MELVRTQADNQASAVPSVGRQGPSPCRPWRRLGPSPERATLSTSAQHCAKCNAQTPQVLSLAKALRARDTMYEPDGRRAGRRSEPNSPKVWSLSSLSAAPLLAPGSGAVEPRR